MTEQAQKETRGFQTEVSQLLDLMVHSLYSKKEIFLRELISNGSDAADKLRFEALADDALYEGDGDLAIDVSVDADARTLTVRDNGIGMSHDEVIENLGTIARSGTRQFFDSLTGDAAKDAQLIGQFGVGFYSCFMVADRVTVTTRKAGAPGEEGVRWESAGDGEFTVEALDVPARGTEVTLQLREGEDEFLDAFRLRHVVRTYSDHIMIPVRMPKPAAEDEDEGGNEAADAEAPEVVNSATALWTRSKSELSEDEYNEFYKHVAHDFEDPLAFTHNRVEGNLEYTTLLYVPARAPFDLWDRSVRRGVKLYVRRVFIMDDAEQLLPAYLRFVRGVIDCADLPLNVSREILQNNRQIDSIRAGSVKRVLDLLGSLAKNEPEKYATFWSHFGRVIKEGMIEDAKNRDAIAKLLRFATTHGEGDAPVTSLDDYVGRMKEGQEKIYFITADSHATAIGSPHLEVFRARGIEVALLTDEVDEWVVNHLTEYEGKPLQSVAKGELDLGDDDPDEADGDTADHGPLVERLKTLLGERVKDVRTTDRLTTSPSCLIAEEHELGAHMERILKAAGQDVPVSKRVMEVNPDHAIAVRLAAERDDDRAADIAHVLYDQAVLGEGGRLDDAAGFVSRVNRLIVTPAKAAARKKRAARPRKKAARPKKAADAD